VVVILGRQSKSELSDYSWTGFLTKVSDSCKYVGYL